VTRVGRGYNSDMPHKNLLPESVSRYVNEVAVVETPVQRRLREHTRANVEHAGMQVSPDQGKLLTLLAKLVNARLAIEVGTYTGYSAICIASALPDDGKLICCDVSDAYTRHAHAFWADAGVANKIDLRIAPAANTLALLISAYAGQVDLAFVDADKSGYPAYYDLCLQLLRPGGAIVLDNMLRGGAVVDDDRDADTQTLRDLTLRIRDDARVDATLLTVGDGFVVARKR
jgi:O-methyltransferase